jgi:hypothetical protein
VVEVGGNILYVIHDVNDLDLDPSAAGFLAVISGHSHTPAIFSRNDVLFLNPGSAGPKRFDLPITLAVIRVQGTTLHPEIIYLDS